VGIRSKLIAVLKHFPVDLTDVFVFGGLAMVFYGLWYVYQPAAWIVAGAFLVVVGMKWA
jgi:hypothetical protein